MIKIHFPHGFIPQQSSSRAPLCRTYGDWNRKRYVVTQDPSKVTCAKCLTNNLEKLEARYREEQRTHDVAADEATMASYWIK